jgi:hypothetical protein
MQYQYMTSVAVRGWGKMVFKTRSGEQRFNFSCQQFTAMQDMLRPPLMHSQSCKSPADQQASKRWATHARHEGGNQRRVASKSGCSAFDLMAALPNLGQM